MEGVWKSLVSSRGLKDFRMFIAYFDYVHSLQIGLVTKGPEDRVGFVKEIQDCVKLGDPSSVQNKDTVIIS